MANTYFQFKEFTVHQDLCAMKVSTDACLFGALVANFLTNKPINSILDIGTGTGLLSLMLAQQTTAMIDAVEIDSGATEQALQNFASSNWQSRLHVHHTAIQNFQTLQLYDCIISNPPFFEHDLKSSNQQKNMALHSTELNFDELAATVKKMLRPNGYFAVLLPFARATAFEQKLKELYLHQKILVKQTPKHQYFRSILIFSTRANYKIITQEIIIKETNQQYSEVFKSLLNTYYLHL